MNSQLLWYNYTCISRYWSMVTKMISPWVWNYIIFQNRPRAPRSHCFQIWTRLELDLSTIKVALANSSLGGVFSHLMAGELPITYLVRLWPVACGRRHHSLIHARHFEAVQALSKLGLVSTFHSHLLCDATVIGTFSPAGQDWLRHVLWTEMLSM